MAKQYNIDLMYSVETKTDWRYAKLGDTFENGRSKKDQGRRPMKDPPGKTGETGEDQGTDWFALDLRT